MELVLPMYNAHPYFFLTKSGKKVHITHGKTRYLASRSFAAGELFRNVVCHRTGNESFSGVFNFNQELYKRVLVLKMLDPC